MIRVPETLLLVSDNTALKTFKKRLPSPFHVRWVIAVQMHTAEIYLQQWNACSVRNEHRLVQKLSKLRSRVCTMIDQHSHLLPGNIFALFGK